MTTTTDEDALLTFEEAGRRLGLASRSTVYALIHDGRLVAKKLGRHTLISAASVTRLIAELPAAKVGPQRRRKIGEAPANPR